MKEFFNDALKALEGDFGWMAEAGMLLFLVLIVNVFLKMILLRLHQHYTFKGIWQDALIMAIIKPITTFVWTLALIQTANFLWVNLLKKPLIIAPHTLVVVGGILSFAWFLLKWKKNVTKRLLADHSIDSGKIDALSKLASLIIYFVTGMLILEQIGSSMNTLVAFGGVSGLAVAFASQQIIANFFGGILIYFTQPFEVGDWITLPEKNIEGYVEDIGWYTTRVRKFDKRPIYIPNTLLTNILVTNPSRMTHRQFKETITLRYADLPLLPAIIRDLEHFFHTQSKIDQYLSPQIHFSKFGAIGIEVEITAYTTIIDKYAYYDIVQELLFGISKVVLDHGADFAIPSTAIEFPKGLFKGDEISSLITAK